MKKARKQIRLIVLIVALLAIIFVILKYVGVPIPVKREVTASQIVVGEGTAEQVTVKIDGVVRLFFGTDNRFDGRFEIEGCAETEGIDVEGYGYEGIYALSYDAAKTGVIAYALTDTLFWRDFAIQVDDGVIFGDGKTVVVYPQVAADEMDEKITELRRTAGWQESLLTTEAAE